MQSTARGRSIQSIEPQGVILALPAPVKKAAPAVKNQAAAVKNQTVAKSKKAPGPARFARGAAVEVRSRIEPQGVILALPAPVKKAASVKNQAASVKNQVVATSKKAPAPARFARGAAVEVRSRIARVLSGRWLVIYLHAEVVVPAAASGADSSYIVRYPAHNGVPSREARVPAEDVREARRVPVPATSAAPPALPSSSSKRPSPDQSTVTTEVACKKTKIVRTGKGIPMDALRRFMEEVKMKYPDAELPPARKHPR